MIVMSNNGVRGRRNNLPAPRTVRVPLAIPQIATGLLCIGVNGALIGVVLNKSDYTITQYWASMGAAGIWGGLFFILGGSLSLLAVKQNNMGALVCYMVMSILNINIAVVVIAFGIMAILQGSGPCYYTRTVYSTGSSYRSNGNYWCEQSEYKDNTIIGLGATLFVLAVAEFFMVIAGLCLLCCCRKPQEPSREVTRHSEYNPEYQPYPSNVYMVGNQYTQYGNAAYTSDTQSYDNDNM